MSTTELTLVDNRTERDRLIERTDVLDKVGVLRTLPDDMHCMTPMVAEFYGVTVEVIRQTVNRNREEFDDDGYLVVSRADVSDNLSLTWDELGVPVKTAAVAMFPRRAVLRVGMLLRDSPVARQVRDYLLDTEQAAPARAELTDDEFIHRALEISVKRIEALKERVAELEPKAELADNYLTAEGGARLVRQVAKTLGLKEHELRTFLLDEEIIFTRHSPCGETQYDHYAQYAHYFKPTEHIVNHRWGSCTHYTLMVIPRGVELIHRRLRDKGII
jgi:phage antirepressor YoqD-like protein